MPCRDKEVSCCSREYTYEEGRADLAEWLHTFSGTKSVSSYSFGYSRTLFGAAAVSCREQTVHYEF